MADEAEHGRRGAVWLSRAAHLNAARKQDDKKAKNEVYHSCTQ